MHLFSNLTLYVDFGYKDKHFQRLRKKMEYAKASDNRYSCSYMYEF